MKQLLAALLILVCSLCLPATVYAQKVLQLSNHKTKKVKVLKSGHRVAYRARQVHNASLMIGHISSISDSTVTINKKEIPLSNLVAIGRRRTGAGTTRTVLTVIGGFRVGYTVAHALQGNIPLKNTGSAVVSTGIGISLIGLAALIESNNSPKDVENRWQLNVIELGAPKVLSGF